MRFARAVAPAAVVLLAALPSGACGYALAGRGSFLPAYIQTIGIPQFVNRTTVFEIERLLTDKVRSEFIGRGKYRILPQDTGVDAVLMGEITSVVISPASFTNEQQASRYVFTMTARITFRDLTTDKVLWENPALVFREEYDVATGTGPLDATAFFDQESNAVDRVATDFAKSVVGAILEAF